MNTVKPVRLQLSRAKGFNLQRLSVETNGLAAVNCARPSRWGNPFVADGDCLTVLRGAPVLKLTKKKIFAADLFQMWLNSELCFYSGRDCQTGAHEDWIVMCDRRKWMLGNLERLAGKNLGCFCRDGMPCHADVLLELANA
jgi:hypothetical protein